MGRPATLPEWATSGVNRLEPSSGKKASGWLAGEEPPSGYFNWLDGAQSDWLKFLEGEASKLEIRAKKTAVARTSTTEVDTAGAAVTSYAVRPSDGRVVHAVQNGAAGPRYGNLFPGTAWADGTYGSSFSGIVKGLHWDGTLFHAFGAQIQSSPDGATWTQRLASGTYHSMATSPGGVRVALSGTDVARSTNGTSWTVTAAPAAFSGSSENIVVWDATNNKFVAILSNGATMHSADGITWTNGGAHGLTGGSSISATYYDRLDAVVIGGHDGSNNYVKYSLDGGDNWVTSALSLPGPSNLRPVFAAAGTLCLWDGSTKLQMFTVLKDAIDWSPVIIPPTVATGGGLARNFTTFLAASGIGLGAFFFSGAGGEVYESPVLGI